MRKQFLGVAIIWFIPLLSYAQKLDDLDDYSVEQAYRKVEVAYGTLDEDGNQIDHVFVPYDITEMEKGLYDIEITDGPGDLYEIIGSDIFLEFRYYFGYAGYREECILEIGAYSATVYKKE